MGDLRARQQVSNATGGSNERTEPEPAIADPQQWSETVETYLLSVYRFVRARVPAGVVDDLVQETFVSAAGNTWRFDPNRASVWSWLVGIARNRIADYYREMARDSLLRDATRALASDIPCIEQTLVSGSALPEEVCERREFRLLTQAALSSLEPRHQACLIARYYNDLSLDQVGQLMNLSPSAANSLLHRARGRLRWAMKRLMGGLVEFEEFRR